MLCGGLRKNPLFIGTHAEACALPVLVPYEGEMVLVGAAMLAAYAGNKFPSLELASKQMASKCRVIQPENDIRSFHDRKYRIFREMVEDQLKYRRIMHS